MIQPIYIGEGFHACDAWPGEDPMTHDGPFCRHPEQCRREGCPKFPQGDLFSGEDGRQVLDG